MMSLKLQQQQTSTGMSLPNTLCENPFQNRDFLVKDDHVQQQNSHLQSQLAFQNTFSSLATALTGVVGTPSANDITKLSSASFLPSENKNPLNKLIDLALKTDNALSSST